MNRSAIAAGGFAAALLASAAAAAAPAGTGAPSDAAASGGTASEGTAEPVAVFAGTGNRTTASFEVESAWEVAWDTTGRRFQLVLESTESQIPSIVADQVQAGSGTRNYVNPGTYSFEVRADGPWRVEVRPTLSGSR